MERGPLHCTTTFEEFDDVERAGKAVDPRKFSPLRPVKTLFEFEGPKTFTFRDQDGELCLAHWCDEEDRTTRYIAVVCSNRLVAQLEQGVISVRDASEQPRAWVLVW